MGTSPTGTSPIGHGTAACHFLAIARGLRSHAPARCLLPLARSRLLSQISMVKKTCDNDMRDRIDRIDNDMRQKDMRDRSSRPIASDGQ